MTASRYETSLSICNQAFIEMGQGGITSLFASADSNVVLLRTLLNSCGRELAMTRPWRHLLKSGSLTAAAAVGPLVYGVNALSADFDYPIDATFYNATDDQPLRPVNEQEWEGHITSATDPDPSIYRLEGNALWLYGDAAGDTITYKYLSRYWVKADGQAAPNLSASSADSDTIYYHPLLITRLLKLRWREARGMDTVREANDLTSTYAAVAGREQVAPIVTLGARRGMKWIDGSNVPDSGYGV